MTQPASVSVHPISLGFVQAYLLESADGLVLVDCGASPKDAEKILAAVQALAKPLRLILITHAHADHYAGAAELRRVSGAPVAIHRLDAPFMASGQNPTRVSSWLMNLVMALGNRMNPAQALNADLLLEDGERLDAYGLPGCVIHTPGHTPGSLTLVLDDQTAFLGDLIWAIGKPGLQRRIVDDAPALAETYRRLRQMELRTIYVGHGQQPLSGEVFNRLVDAQA